MAKNRKKLHSKYKARRIILIVFAILILLAIGVFLGSKMSYKKPVENTDILESVYSAEQSTESSTEPQPQASQPVSSETSEVSTAESEKDPNSWELILVSSAKPISEDFTVELGQITGEFYLDTRIVDTFKQMIAKAKSDGINLKVYAAYRDPAEQEKLFNKQVEYYMDQGFTSEQAHEKTMRKISDAWTTEHHTGLAIDISTPEIGIDNSFEDTAAFKWLDANAKEYGFILRYPKDKEAITRFDYDPCHYRYVGVENAKIMYENGYILEEYLFMLEKNKNKEILSSEAEDEETESTSSTESVTSDSKTEKPIESSTTSTDVSTTEKETN